MQQLRQTRPFGQGLLAKAQKGPRAPAAARASQASQGAMLRRAGCAARPATCLRIAPSASVPWRKATRAAPSWPGVEEGSKRVGAASEGGRDRLLRAAIRRAPDVPDEAPLTVFLRGEAPKRAADAAASDAPEASRARVIPGQGVKRTGEGASPIATGSASASAAPVAVATEPAEASTAEGRQRARPKRNPVGHVELTEAVSEECAACALELGQALADAECLCADAVALAEAYSPERFRQRAGAFGLRAGLVLDLRTWWNLAPRDHQEAARRGLAEEKPYLLVLSPMCVAFSALQRLTPDSEKFRALLADGRKHLEFAAELAGAQLDRGGRVLFEHPWAAASWLEPALRALLARPSCRRVRCDQCLFGLRTTDKWGEVRPAQKSTGFLDEL